MGLLIEVKRNANEGILESYFLGKRSPQYTMAGPEVNKPAA